MGWGGVEVGVRERGAIITKQSSLKKGFHFKPFEVLLKLFSVYSFDLGH